MAADASGLHHENGPAKKKFRGVELNLHVRVSTASAAPEGAIESWVKAGVSVGRRGGKGRIPGMNHKQDREPLASPRKEASSELLGANSEIGRKLRQLYDEVVSEDVPDRFAQLLNKLDKAESSRNGN